MWCRFDDDILCWSDVIVMITAGHIRVPTHGKPKLTLLSPDNTHHISPEIIFKSPLAPVPTFSQSPSDASQILTGNLQTNTDWPGAPAASRWLHLSLILRGDAEIYWKWTCNLCISPKYLIIPQINSLPSVPPNPIWVSRNRKLFSFWLTDWPIHYSFES